MNDLISRQAALEAIKNCESGENFEYNEGLIAAMNAVVDTPSAQEWIPVTERLPLYGQDVLAVRAYGDGEKYREVLIAHIAVRNKSTGEKWWNATNITHWMPLPSTEGLNET